MRTYALKYCAMDISDTANKPSAAIRIATAAFYLAEQSSPEQGHYTFSYTISIHNGGDQLVQLLTRHWLISDADGRVQEVNGDGVIGEQPRILPGETHTYSSGTIIETPVATMEGRYGMIDNSGQAFDAPIPVFRLAIPGVLN
jgi:ApaG protein